MPSFFPFDITIIKDEINGFLSSGGRNKIKVYWFIETDNFGDLLNPVLLKYYRLNPIHTERNNAEALVIGSILEKQPEDYSGYIVGAGLKWAISKKFPKAKILAVRGKLTRDFLGASKDVVLGDPGLLVPYLFPKREGKKYVLGLIPHYKDKQDQRFRKISLRYPHNVLIIDVQRKPKEVVVDIDQCEYILSSSLHGLVVADSLGIPNAWLVLSENAKRDGFKFKDYASAINREIQSETITGFETLNDLITKTIKVNNDQVFKIQQKLNQVFENFSEIVRNR